MTARRWRVALVPLCLFNLALMGYWLASIPTTDVDLGVAATASAGAPFLWRIEVKPGRPLATAGVRSGDVVDARAMTPADRFHVSSPFSSTVWRGDRPTVAVVRGSKTVMIAVTAIDAKPVAFSVDAILSFVGSLLLGIFALAIAWRRSDRPEARVIVLILGSYLLWTYLAGGFNLVTPWPLIDALGLCGSMSMNYIWVALIATYAACFARPLSPWRSALTWITYASATLFAVAFGASIVGLWTGSIDPFDRLFDPWALTGEQIFVTAAALAAAFAGWRATSANPRSLMTWTLIPLVTMCLAAVLGNIQSFVPGYLAINNVSGFLVALLFAYVMLSRKLGDIGFVVNRAVVFSLVSVVLVGAFVLIEWLLADWLRYASHTTNTLVTAVVVVALGTSLRFVHKWADRIVDVVLFRKRHEDQQAIRTFAEEAVYVTDRTVLLDRAHAVLTRYTDATSVAILVRGNDGRFGPADENDPAVLRLSVTHRPLDLHGFETAFAGEMVYPMVARGRLLGVIVLGERRSGELVPPDESAAIAHLAHGVAHALETLDQRRDRDGLIEHIEQLSEKIDLLVVRAQTVP